MPEEFLMSNLGTPFNRSMIMRVVALGLVVFAAFLGAAGLLWMLGSSLGLSTTFSLILGACLGPLLVTVPVLLWFYRLPLERRQRLLGVPVSFTPPEESPPETVE